MFKLSVIVLSILMIPIFIGCQEEDVVYDKDAESLLTRSSKMEKADTTLRMIFESEEDLAYAISGSMPDAETYGIPETERDPEIIIGTSNFVSMLSNHPVISAQTGYPVSYYEALGYDSLVPNLNFAKLLNIHGEMQVSQEIIKITSNGTYRFPAQYEKECLEYIKEHPNAKGILVAKDIYRISDKISLINTFAINPNDYSLISDGNYTELPDDYFDETLATRASIPEPNFNDFQIFSADKKTVVGKIIQNIIGSTKTSTINFNKKRRVRGSFYFYNYGVYGEIGVKGWTDKKNTIGWSKTASDELRVGWRNVLLKYSLPNKYKESLKGVKDVAYYPPKYIDINGKRANAATLIMPDLPVTLKDKIIAKGVKAAYDYIRSKFGQKATDFDKADACILATPSELYFIVDNGDVIKRGEKSYCHVFAKNYMQFTIGWSNTGGFFLGSINQNNYTQLGSWFNTIKDAMNQEKVTLVGGEVYVCARFGNDWRGMKIIKK